jgi:glycosyltransferase involved in cell wall biosynthesis
VDLTLSETPKISVLLAVHNAARYLDEALDSVFAQSFGDFEIVAVDDGSTDATHAILAARKDPRLRLVRLESNRGHTTALNFGLRMCRGEYVARMDGDDICRPERFARQIAVLESDPSLGIVGSAVTIVDGAGGVRDFAAQPLSDGAIRFVSMTRNPFHHPTVVLRMRVLRENGLEFDERFQANQDFELWTRLLPRTRAANLREPLLQYRVHGGNISISRLAEQQRTSVDFCRKRQRDEGFDPPFDSEALYAVFDAVHGSSIAGRPRLTDAALALSRFVELAERAARDDESREWAASVAMRVWLTRRLSSGRGALLARIHALDRRAVWLAVRDNANSAARLVRRRLARAPWP